MCSLIRETLPGAVSNTQREDFSRKMLLVIWLAVYVGAMTAFGIGLTIGLHL